eukprot:3204353-Prymnesium_polylepis.1
MEKFTFTGTRRCGIKDGLRADGKFSMPPVADPRYLFDEKVPADWYLEFPLRACADFFKLPYTGVIDRVSKGEEERAREERGGGGERGGRAERERKKPPLPPPLQQPRSSVRFVARAQPDLQELLLEECRAIKPDFLVNSAKVSGYTHRADGGVTLQMGDGTTNEADGARAATARRVMA